MVASVTQLSEGPGVYRNVVGEHNWSLSPTLRMHQKCFGLRFAPIFHLAAIEDSTAGSRQRKRGAPTEDMVPIVHFIFCLWTIEKPPSKGTV